MREDVEHIMHHDLKGPLSSILSTTALFKQYDNITERQQEFLNMMELAGWRMLRMIDMSLVLLKIEYGTYNSDLVLENLPAMLRKIAEELALTFRKKGIALQINIPEDLQSIQIMTDPLLLYNLLTNLLKNAYEACPDNGNIWLNICKEDHHYRLVIGNQGEVPKEIQSSFFDKFITAGKQQGIGLGTYSAKLIAGALKINLVLDTKQPGQTQLILDIPIAPKK